MKNMNGFEKRALLIKEKIMKTTLEMLKTWEPSRIRIVDISKEAKVSQVTIYNYFGSKEALLHEVVKGYVNKSIKEFEEYMNGEYSLKEKIEFMLFQEKESYKTLTPGIVKELMIDDREIYKYIEEQYNEKIIPQFIHLINEGKEKGEISDKVSISAVLIFINMFMKQSKELLEIAQQQENMDQFIEEMVQVFFYGICGR